MGNSPFGGTIDALASQFSGAMAPFPNTPAFAGFKQSPRPPTLSPSVSDIPRQPLAGGIGFGGGRQPYGGAMDGGFGARQPFDSSGGPRAGAGASQGATWQGGGSAGASDNAGLDVHNAAYNSAMSAFGTPANMLKAMINRESSGNWERDGNRIATFQRFDGSMAEILPFVGITKAAADSWGLDFYAMQGDKQAQVNGMAKIMSGLSAQHGGYDNAMKVYFGGTAALQGNWNDENGLGSDYYYNQAKSDWTRWDGGAGSSGLPSRKWGETGLESNTWVQDAMSYVGTEYVWGSIPNANQDPRQTGWDCSGLTRWFDQKYGNGSLPMGSHYQFQYAQQSGQLFTDMSQLQSGDLVFIDSGWQGGGGAELNKAGHVAVYLGNGQILQAANPQTGTVIAPLSGYSNILGGMHQSFSGGGGAGQSASNNPYRKRRSW